MPFRDPWEVDVGQDPWEAPPAPPVRRQSPAETVSRLRSDPDYEPTPEELQAAHGDRWKIAAAGILPGIKEAVHRIAVDLPKKGLQAEAERFKTLGPLGYLGSYIPRQAATLAEGAIRGTAGLGDLIRPPIQAGADFVARQFSGLEGEQQNELARQQWADRVRKGGEEAQAMAPYNEGEKSFIPGANPAGAAELGEFVDPTLLIPAARAAGAIAKGADLAKGGVTRAAVRAAAPVVEKGAETAANAAKVVKTGLDAVQPVADVAGLVTGGFGGLGATHAAGRGASAVLGWADKVRDVGTSLRAVGNADWRSAMPVWMQLAKDADAPVWLRRASSSAVAPLVEKSLRASGSVARGSVEGAAIGAAVGVTNDTMTPEEKGAAIGAGAALGAGGAAGGHVAGSGARAEIRQAHDIAMRAAKAIESGASPEAVLSAPDSLMYYADNLEKLFAGAMPNGKSLKVDLVDGAQFAQLQPEGGVAYFTADGDQPRVVVNLEAPEADGRALHEVIGHALAESVVASQPEILAKVRAVVDQVSGGTSQPYLQAASEQYATALLGNDASPERIAQFIIEQRARSTSTHGDPDAWILSEIWAESTVRAVGGKDLTDLATPGFYGRAARLLQRFDTTRGLGDKLEAADIASKSGRKFGTSDQTFFSQNISQALDSPELHQMAVKGLRDVAAYRPGVDKPVDRGIRVNPREVGKVEHAQLHDLGGGLKGNDFAVATPDGRVVARPPAQVRQLVRNRRKAVNAAVPPDQPPALANDKDPFVKVRTTISGLIERSGRKLGDWFYKGNVFSETTKDTARKLEQAIENGQTLAAWYHQIGESSPDWRGSVEKDYGNIEARYKDFVPVDFLITKAGNLIVRNYSLSSLERKAQQWAARKGDFSLELWNGDVGQFKQDVQAYLKNHSEGRPGADGIGDQKRNVINAFLIGRNVTFGDKNPLRARIGGEDRQGLVRSYRLDRLEPVEPSEVTGFAKPDYSKQVRNLSPDVAPVTPDGVPDRVPGNEATEDRPRKRIPKEQLEFEFSKAIKSLGTAEGVSGDTLKTAPDQGGSAAGVAGTGVKPGLSITASRLRAQFKVGPANPIGMSAAKVEDRHAIAALFRNPIFEAFRWVFTKDGKVVRVLNVTARSPDTTYLHTKNLDLATIEKHAVDSEADGFFWTHNHPSGDSAPSEAYIRATFRFFDRETERYPAFGKLKFLGHIVTNHDTHHLISTDGFVEQVRRPAGEDLVLSDPIWSKRIDNPSALAEAASALASGDDSVTVIFTDPRKQVKSVAELDPTTSPDEFLHQAAEHATSVGATTAFGYSTNPGHAELLIGLVKRGVLYDAIGPWNKNGVRASTIAPDKKLVNPLEPEHQIVSSPDEKLRFSPAVTPGEKPANLPRNEEGPQTGVPKRGYRIDPAVRGAEFAAAIRRTKAEHKLGYAVDDKGDEFYLDPKNSLFLAEDGLAGVAVTADKDLVSVFKHPTSKADIKPVLQEAAEASHTLDAFDINGFLPDLYAKFGFKPVARVPFNREFAPEGWDYKGAGEPDVVLMVRDPENKLGIPAGKYDTLRQGVPSFADYGDAVAAQQAAKAKVFGDGRQMSPGVYDRARDAAAEEYFDKVSNQRDSLLSEWSNNRDGRVSIPTIPSARLKKIWLDYGKSGVVRDEKGLFAIADKVVDLVARLKASTEFSGHESYDPFKEFELDEAYGLTDADKEKFLDFLSDPDTGGFYLSDFGLPKLEKLVEDLLIADTAEDKLHVIDKILNVAHQRSDLAAWIVEGGTKTLNEIAEQGGYSGAENRQMSPDVSPDPSDSSALPVEYVLDKKGNKVMTLVKGKLKPKTITKAYNFLESPIVNEILDAEPDPAAAREMLFGRKGIRTKLNTSRLIDRKPLTPEEQTLYRKIVDRYATEFVDDYNRYANDPDVAAARGWYSDVSDFIKSIIPDATDRSHFLEFLGGTSPNTDVETNYLYALDLFNRWKKGEFEGLVERYNKVEEAHRNGELIPQIATSKGEGTKTKYSLLPEKRTDFIATLLAAGVEKKDALAIARKPKKTDLLGYFLLKENALPVRKGGGKYGIHSDRIIQILDRKWLEETDAPKAPNFTGNLEGSRRTATVDVWAARLLRRLGYEKKSEGPWRIQPMSESGVKNYDFFFGQDVFDETARRITEAEGRTMNPDDLQAIAWFGEKREWAKRGWSKDEDLGDFRQYLYKTVPADETGKLKIKDGELNSASEDFLDSLTPGQFENVRVHGAENALKTKAMKPVQDAEKSLNKAPNEDRKAYWKQKLEERRKIAAEKAAKVPQIRVTK